MRTALLLPGQGSQEVGMGRDLAERWPEARELFELADEILGHDLSRLCWEGPEGELTRTENAQPAILLHSFAAWRLLPDALRDSVVVAAGHSLGEFTAYLCAGSLSFEDALRLVRRRGELMARSDEGTMAAVLGLDDDRVEELCRRNGGTVVAANYNAPGQVVVSGEEEAVRRVGRRAEEEGARRVIPLQVSGAFHSPLMEVAREGLAEALEATEFGDPEFPVVANVSAEPVTSGAEARRLLVEQLTSPVRWTEGVRAMGRREPEQWLEVGPGRVLTGLLRRIDRSRDGRSAGDAETLAELRSGGRGPGSARAGGDEDGAGA